MFFVTAPCIRKYTSSKCIYFFDMRFSALLWKITSLEQQICKLQDSMDTITRQNEELMKYVTFSFLSIKYFKPGFFIALLFEGFYLFLFFRVVRKMYRCQSNRKSRPRGYFSRRTPLHLLRIFRKFCG